MDVMVNILWMIMRLMMVLQGYLHLDALPDIQPFKEPVSQTAIQTNDEIVELQNSLTTCRLSNDVLSLLLEREEREKHLLTAL
jgi:hypothetical protein